MTEITLVRNDKNFYLKFLVTYADGSVLDLSNVSSVKLKIARYGASDLFATIDGGVTDPSRGTCQFLVGEQFVGVTGEFKAEIEITFNNGTVLTAPGITIKVIPDLP